MEKERERGNNGGWRGGLRKEGGKEVKLTVYPSLAANHGLVDHLRTPDEVGSVLEREETLSKQREKKSAEERRKGRRRKLSSSS